MMNLLSQALYLVSNAFHIYVFFYCFRTMFGRPKFLILERASFVAFFVLNSTAFILVNNPYLNLLSSIAPMLLISLIYKQRVHFKLLISTMVYVSSMLLDSIFYNITDIILPENADKVSYMNVIPSLFLFLFALIAKRILTADSNKTYVLPIWSAIFIIPLSSILVVTVSFYNEYDYVSTLLIMSTFLFINIIAFWLFDKLSEYYQSAFEKQFLAEQVHAYAQQMAFINEQNEVVRGIRHDMRNHITYLSEFLNTGNTLAAQEYLKTMGTYLFPQKEYICSGNSSLDSFLNYKLEAIDKSGGVIGTNITIPEQLPYPAFDLCIIFGNLLDNVQEAFSRMPTDAEKHLTLKIRFDRGMLYIKASNSFAGTLIKIKSKDSFIYKTQKENPSEHGRGLTNVENVVKSFGGTIDILDEDKLYTVEIILFLNN